MTRMNGLRIGGALVALALVSACSPSVESLSCDRIVDEAKRISQSQQLKITEISNVSEQSRTEREARCTGTATFDNNATSPINIRAYYGEGDNTMVEYSTEPFTEAPAQ